MKFESGQKILCNTELWQGKIGIVVESFGDKCRVRFGDLDFLIEIEYLEPFNSEFLQR